MIRFYAITMWPVMAKLGYTWLMRMDDESVLGNAKVPITYNLFDRMRQAKHVYGWRQIVTLTPRVCQELRLLRNASPELHSSWAWRSYCERHSNLGFYNNWFISSIDWWLTPRVQAMHPTRPKHIPPPSHPHVVFSHQVRMAIVFDVCTH
jgi:hypothetical protein